jgi:hypothetical protein
MGELITEHKQAAKIMMYHYKAQVVLHPLAGTETRWVLQQRKYKEFKHMISNE